MKMSFLQKIRIPETWKTPRVKKRLKRAFTALMVTAALLGAIGVFIGYFFEDTVKRIIIDQLNKSLNCRIEVADIEFSVFQKFPYATLHFIDAVAYDALPDTSGMNLKGKPYDLSKRYGGEIKDSILLKAEDVYLQMSLIDLLFSEYRMKRIEVDNAVLNLKVFKDGTDNFHFLKHSSDTTDTSAVSFDLEKLVARNVAASYLNIPARQDYRIRAGDLMMKGLFSGERYEMNIDGNVFVYRIVSRGENYFGNRQIELDVDMLVDEARDEVSFSEGQISIGTMVFSLLGYVAYGDDREELDLDISGNDLPLHSFLTELPGNWRQMFEDYKGKGNFNFRLGIKGKYGGRHQPGLLASFSLQKGELVQKASGITLTDVNLKASYTNGDQHRLSTSVLDIPEFSAKLNEHGLSGSFSMTNFVHPDLAVVLKGSFDLEDLHGFLQADTIQSMSGLAEFDFSFKGKPGENGGFSAKDFVGSTSSGKIKLSKAKLEFKNQKLALKEMNGDFSFSNNDIISHNFTGFLGSMDFSLSGYFRNMFSWLFLKDERLQVVADFSSQHINMDELLQYKVSSQDTVMKLEISPQLDLDLDVNARRFSMGRFSASGVLCELKVRNQQILIRDLSFNAMDGRVSASGLIDASREGKLLTACEAKFNRVDIRKMFYQLGNFGQSRLVDENLSGSLSADISFGATWSNTFEADLASVYANATLTIENGELIRYAPIEGLNKQLKGRNFSNIKFATLKTQVSIKDQLITLPETRIVNDAIDFDIKGTHTFDNEIDYHVSILFADLLNKKKNESEFGPVEDDGLHKERYYFRITGTTENPVYKKIDKDAYIKSISSALKEEKKTIWNIIKDEFRKNPDTSAVKKPGDKVNNNGGEWQLQWEEEEE